MGTEESSQSSLVSIGRRLATALLAVVQNRLDLAALEFQEEKCRFFQALIWGAVLLFTGAFAILLVTLSVIVLVWQQAGETAGLSVLAGFAIFYCLAAWWAVNGLKRHIANWPPPFAHTLAEIKKDCECLRPPK